ncbi:ribonuclease P/MRP protein subunit [Saccharomycopsis crataegensis]|uniref:Ribonuclease P/MRP protein subunit n=1 Tax=Saccharomycopsis crataegensis TaxID=43959 RepID=A0AAV5QGZ8_9ASCO|nr:ribonuclease P/MRP protein subunit [Saccharomycopsis crataegensis]
MPKRPQEAQISNKSAKKSRLYNSRIIRSETNDPAFKDGTLDVPSFVNSRKFEIEQLEKSQLSSKNAKSTRVFQALPRKLRRRGASHNVKRIPKRLRNKAIREMLSSNKQKESGSKLTTKKTKKITAKQIYQMKLKKNLLKVASKVNLLKILPSDKLLKKNLNIRSMTKILSNQIREYERTKKLESGKHSRVVNNSYGSYDNTGVNQPAPPLISKLKYLKRQKNYKWLSTHIWHAKRFHLIKRWGWNIPYKPTQKSFKLTHRSFKSSGSIVFDTSYEGTIIIETTSNGEDGDKSWNSLKNVIQNLIQKKLSINYVNGRKFYTGNLYAKHEGEFEILSTGLVYCSKDTSNVRVLVQVHPANFQELWSNLSSQLSQNFNTKMYDCRYSMGSIDLIGPKSIEALVSILHPVDTAYDKKWGMLNNISEIESLGEQTILSFLIHDPRFHKKPVRRRSKLNSEDHVLDLIIDIKNGKLSDPETNKLLFSADGRTESYSNQMTIKQINKRRRKLENPGQVKLKIKNDDSKIPILILMDSKSKRIKLFAPWYWISPIWYHLVKIPKILPGGLLQINQINFEINRPYYPNDYPYTKDGFIENELIAKEAEEMWKKKPKKKRLNYESTLVSTLDQSKYQITGEMFNWSNCDWRSLQLFTVILKVYEKLNAKSKEVTKLETPIQIWDNAKFLRKNFAISDIIGYVKSIKVIDDEKNARGEKLVNPIMLNLYNPKQNQTEIARFNQVIENYLSLVDESVSNERVAKLLDNRLPVNNVKVHLLHRGKIKSNARIYAIPKDFHQLIESPYKEEIIRQCPTIEKLIKLHNTNDLIKNCPTFENLIGFVTTGAMNLEKGYYTGLGCVSSESIYKSRYSYCIIRNPGSKTVRVGEMCIY